MMAIAASSSPVPSEVFALIALLVLSLGVLLILRYYLPLRTTPAFLLVPVFFALWLPAVIVLLVPIDLASIAATTEDGIARGIWLPERLVEVSWRITYWLTFALTWFILPILAEYADSGYREPKEKFLYSLRQNAQYYGIMLGAGVIGLIYYLFSYGFDVLSLKGPIMAIAYCWSLILAIYLMGHGLVAIPRHLIRNASISDRLRRIQMAAPRLYEKVEDAEMNLDELETLVSELSRRKTGSARDFRDWIEELVDMTNLPDANPRATAMAGDGTERTLPTVITEKYMAELTRDLVRAKHARSRYVSEWNRLLQAAVETQAVLDSAASRKLDFGESPHPGFWSSLKILNPYTRYLIHWYFAPYARIFFGVFFALASACIVWSELVKFAFPDLSIIRLSVLHHRDEGVGRVGLAGQFISSLWILYMCAAALTSMTEVKVWRGRALVRRNTAHESAFWYASYVARLSVPLSFNFMQFLRFDEYKGMYFYKFLGVLINLTPLGVWFNGLFPIFILVPVCATLFGLYSRVRNLFGFGADIIDDEDGNEPGYGTGSWREGRDIIERELNGTAAGLRSRRQEALARTRGLDVPNNPAGRSAPVVSVPGDRRADTASPALGGSPSRAGAGAAGASSRQAGRGARSTAPLTEPGDENFFESISHRFKNTIDTIDTPKWFQDIKRPKWMGGREDDEAGSSRPGGEGRSNSDVRRWFGGSESRIRL